MPLRYVRLSADIRRYRRLVDDLLDLAAAEDMVRSREAHWRKRGLAVHFTWGMKTPKPAAWLTLEGPESVGQWSLWVSGEVELEVGSTPEDAYQRHEDGVTGASIGVLMDELAARVLLDGG